MRFFGKKQLTDYEQEMYELDWFRRTSWFSSYFWEKLKNMLLNLIYRMYTSLEDVLLKKYLLEIEFYSPKSNKLDDFNKKHSTEHKGDFKCYLPLILKVKCIEESYEIQTSIIKQLQESGFYIISSNISNEFVTDEMLNHKIKQAKGRLKGDEIQTMYLETRTLKKSNLEEESKTFHFYSRTDKFHFSVRKIRPDALYLLSDFNVIIEKNTYEE